MTDRIRIGIIGAGNIATLNVPGYLAHEQCDVVALCDPRGEVLGRRMSEWNIGRGYADVEKLLADDDIDAVEILSPTPLHAAHTIAALEAGKHVSVQKPIANTVSEARRMVDAARTAGKVFRVTEQCCHFPPLVKARELVRAGAIGDPTVIRIKTVVGRTESEFQAHLDPAGYTWRFNAESPGGHLFDDVMHKYAMALWLVDSSVRSVQAVVRPGPLFFEAPTVALFEYQRDDLLGMMEVSYAPDMFIRSDYYGADEFFEIQGTRGFIWVTRLCGNLHVDLAPIVLYEEDGRRSVFSEIDASYSGSFARSAGAFVDALLAGTPVDLAPETAIEALQLCFAVYQASNSRQPVDPGTIEDSVSPVSWPPTEEKMRTDVEEMFRREAARAERLGTP
ncbi:MAG TPA: Gfo/Idh/MocA family oxidoreductase [Acidimicrobiia bacterium]|nr:Gfo/Idh/MocA family oxidoreductase [Acidimicrobiia bacterium]